MLGLPAASTSAPLARTLRAPACRSAPGRRQRLALVAQAGPSAAAPSAEAPTLAELKNNLSTAVQAEDYAEAARLRDAITALEAADPVLQLEGQLEAAVREQRFEVRPPAAAALCHGPQGRSLPSAHRSIV